MMFDFAEVVKANKRMCDACRCDICPVSSDNNGTGLSCEDFRDKFPNEYAKIVMQWEEQLTEQKYPTWLEFLDSMGLGIAYREIPGDDTTWVFSFKEAEKPIPADIAQELGIEPKSKEKNNG